LTACRGTEIRTIAARSASVLYNRLSAVEEAETDST
jgi:hypothetical protein